MMEELEVYYCSHSVQSVYCPLLCSALHMDEREQRLE